MQALFGECLGPRASTVWRPRAKIFIYILFGVHVQALFGEPRARQDDTGTGAHNMGTCLLARLSLLSMLNHGFVIEAVHGHESNITWSRRARQEDRGTGAHNMGTCPLTRLSPRG